MKLLEKEIIARRILMWVLVYSIPAFQALLPVEDPDLWWHLRTGQWIVENHAVPFQDYFSAYGMGKTWIAYSWLFELIIYAIYSAVGLIGIVIFTLLMSLLIALVLHALVRRARLPFALEIILMAVALGSMKPLISPRPWLFSILFFSVELLIITRVRESSNERGLWLLPLFFFLWTNLHIQFVYGLAALGLLFFEALLVTGLGWFGYKVHAPQLSPARIAAVGGVCLLATLASPYHVLIYKPLVEYVGQTGAFQNISELQPLFFRSPSDWMVLLLTLSAVLVLGRQRKWMPFPAMLLLMGVFLGFRARRDVWVVVLASIGIVSGYFRAAASGNSFTITRVQAVSAAVIVALALYGLSLWRQITETNLRAAVAMKYPVDAVAYIRAHQIAGPMFNTLDWGGYLIWGLPELPVAIDGRTNLHGDKRVAGLLHTWLGYPGWDSNRELLSANLVIADKQRPLTSLLRIYPGYKIAYEDGVAVVFVPVR